MKNISKKPVLLGLFLLGVVALIGFVNALIIDISSISSHKVRLHSLYLGSGEDESDYARFYVNDDGVLKFGSGLMFGDSDDSNVGIGGGNGNIINGDNSDFTKVIGGGENNYIYEDGGVIVGGGFNVSSNLGIVVGGTGNSANNSTILGGQGNFALNNSFVFGHNSRASDFSFSWNSESEDNSARIDANNGVLVGTYQAVTGVNLVVAGPVKIAGEEIEDGNCNDDNFGEIRAVSGCFYSCIDDKWRIINNGDISSCDFLDDGYCIFGNAIILEGQTVTGYSQNLGNCEPVQGTCGGGSISPNLYPYCYNYTS